MLLYLFVFFPLFLRIFTCRSLFILNSTQKPPYKGTFQSPFPSFQIASEFLFKIPYYPISEPIEIKLIVLKEPILYSIENSPYLFKNLTNPDFQLKISGFWENCSIFCDKPMIIINETDFSFLINQELSFENVKIVYFLKFFPFLFLSNPLSLENSLIIKHCNMTENYDYYNENRVDSLIAFQGENPLKLSISWSSLENFNFINGILNIPSKTPFITIIFDSLMFHRIGVLSQALFNITNPFIKGLLSLANMGWKGGISTMYINKGIKVILTNLTIEYNGNSSISVLNFIENNEVIIRDSSFKSDKGNFNGIFCYKNNRIEVKRSFFRSFGIIMIKDNGFISDALVVYSSYSVFYAAFNNRIIMNKTSLLITTDESYYNRNYLIGLDSLNFILLIDLVISIEKKMDLNGRKNDYSLIFAKMKENSLILKDFSWFDQYGYYNGLALDASYSINMQLVGNPLNNCKFDREKLCKTPKFLDLNGVCSLCSDFITNGTSCYTGIGENLSLITISLSNETNHNENSANNAKTVFIICIGAPILTILLVGIFLCFYCFSKKQEEKIIKSNDFDQNAHLYCSITDLMLQSNALSENMEYNEAFDSHAKNIAFNLEMKKNEVYEFETLNKSKG